MTGVQGTRTPSGSHPLPTRPGAPDGYTRFLTTRGADVVALAPLARAVREAMTYGTLHAYGERQFAERVAGARRLQGRGPVYAVTLPDRRTRVVIRHARHGGLLAPLTGDRFLAPTRAPRELAAARRLRDAGVPTPEVIAYALYPAGPFLFRSDVATREVPGRDLGESLREAADGATRDAMLEATATLLRAMARAGARHPDLNVKNVLLARTPDGTYEAHVLDVDRVHLRRAGDARAAAANLARLTHSARKWGEQEGVRISDEELERLADHASGRSV